MTYALEAWPSAGRKWFPISWRRLDCRLPRLRFHDLRHTHATVLLGAGVNVKVVSERLGHASVAFTLDTYAHVMPGMQESAAEELDRFLLPEIVISENVVKRLSRCWQRGGI